MPYANTTYGPYGMRTTVGGPSVGTAGAPAGANWMSGLLARRAAQQIRQGDIENQLADLQLKQATRAYHHPPVAPRPTPIQRQAADEAGLASIAQSRAQYAPAPTDWHFGPGATPAYAGTMSPYMMTGAQRQAFLPGSSQITGGPTPSETFATQRAMGLGANAAQQGGIEDFLAMMAGSRPGFGMPSMNPAFMPSSGTYAGGY